MTAPQSPHRARDIVERIWREHRTALMARAPDASAGSRFSRAFESPNFDPEQMLKAIESAMRQPEKRLEIALREAFEVLAPRSGIAARGLGEALAAKRPEVARALAAALAEDVGDGLVASWRLFDHPAGVRLIWLRDQRGPALFSVVEGQAVRKAPAEIATALSIKFGSAARKTLRALVEHPHGVEEIEALVGPEGLRVLEAAHRLLILRRVAGSYRPRGEIARLVLAGM